MCHIKVEWRDMQSSELTLGSQEQLKTCKWRKSLLCGTQEFSKDTSEDQWQAQHISIQGGQGTPEFLPQALKNFKAKQTLEAGPKRQTNMKAKIQMDRIGSKVWPSLITV